jgi:hypothetical protein
MGRATTAGREGIWQDAKSIFGGVNEWNATR